MTPSETPGLPDSVERLQAEVERLRSALVAQEHASRRQYDMLDALFVRSTAAISVNRISDGAFVDVNRRWERLTGYSWQEAMGRTTLDLGFWSSKEARDTAFGHLAQSDLPPHQEVPFTTRDGRKLLLLMTGTRLNLSGVPHAVVYLNDITEHKAAQALSLIHI